jgi:hypothetical protein
LETFSEEFSFSLQILKMNLKSMDHKILKIWILDFF